MSFCTFHFFSFQSRSNFVFSMIDEAAWVVFFCANWSDCCKIFKTMRSSIKEFTKLIFLWAISSIAFLETESSVSLTTRRNVFLNFSCWFLITNDLDPNLAWEALVCTADTDRDHLRNLIISITNRSRCKISWKSKRTDLIYLIRFEHIMFFMFFCWNRLRNDSTKW